ncbi:HD domain-containing protein [Clostridium psychrophilum]|uniref:HD domain-containing protein n=1 Tax=Clostridium psychrophilum TaxID=132926 RepID=UPI001C0AB8EB|nr:HD domain-containing protein [Clostridium psychrophilum]MBU3182132.1 HD domain-containing protein [Clostridium psychrophilum]
MNSVKLVEAISDIVEERSKKDTNIFGYEIWTYHVAIVVKYAKLLAAKLGADKEIVEISALLHDYASIKDSSMYKEHHMYGAIEAEKILNGFNYPKERTNKVKECIIQHRGSVPIDRTTKESICIASADAMAHIDQVPSLLHLVYYKREMDVVEGANWVIKKLERSWNKLCPEAKEIMKCKYESAKIILNS